MAKRKRARATKAAKKQRKAGAGKSRKSAARKQRKAAPAAERAAAPAASAAPAAAEVNKAQAVRAALAGDPKAGPKAVAAKLQEQGLDISPAYVSLVKWQARQRRRKAKPAAPPAAGASQPSAAPAGATITVEALIQAKKLAAALGGVEVARQALEALNKLLG